MKNTFRRFCIQRSYYFDTHDGQGNVKENAPSEQEWTAQILKDWSDLTALGLDENLIIVHDSDIDKDGNPKGLHMHCVPHFRNQTSEESAMKKFGCSSVQNAKHCKNYSGAVQYLCHVTQDAINDLKTIYMPDKIFGFALNEKGEKVRLSVREVQERMRRKTDKTKQEEEQAVSEMLIEVAEGRALSTDIQEMYKNDEKGVGLSLRKFYKDKSLYKMAEQDYIEQAFRFYQENSHPSTLIYITGAGASGKSNLAKALAVSFADARGVHMVGAPGRSTTFDFAGKYNGQRVSVFNEVPPDAFPVEQFLDVFDPLQVALVNSRNSDKPYFAECAIFTASMPFEKFLYELWKPYARENANLSTSVRRSLSGSSTESDWHHAYITCGGFDIGNKISQIRRRFAVCVDIKQNGTAEIRIFDKHCNPSYSLLYPSKVFPSAVPFVLFNTVRYDVNFDDDTVDMLTKKAVVAIQKAVRAYYVTNNFKLPEDYPRPFAAEERPEPEELPVSVEDFFELSTDEE